MATTNRSRYKDTPIDTDPAQDTFYDLFVVPPEFVDPTTTAFQRYVIQANDVGFPDLIAARQYGFGNEDLWWIIALLNGIIDPETELQPGTLLLIPPLSLVQAFLSRKGGVA